MKTLKRQKELVKIFGIWKELIPAIGQAEVTKLINQKGLIKYNLRSEWKSKFHNILRILSYKAIAVISIVSMVTVCVTKLRVLQVVVKATRSCLGNRLIVCSFLNIILAY